MAETPEIVQTVRQGYAFEGPAIELGALLVDGMPNPAAAVRIPLSMVNRHGLVAGATGTGKTKTLQLMAEQLSAAGVAVFAADIKGDLSGVSQPGAESEKLLARTKTIGQEWTASGFPTDFYALGGQGTGTPVRATITSFGPVLLSKVLGLNDVQESSLGLIFHYADQRGLTLLDLKDLRAVIQYLAGDEGKQDLKQLGGLSSATAGVILRALIGFADQGAEAFFGEPEFDTADLMQERDGKGVISLLELPHLQDRPALFSTFLMWLLADLFHDLPEALKATVSTFPNSSYDLAEVLTELGIGEAIVTVMNERGAPTPVAWTRLRAPRSLMAPASAEQLTASVQASPNNAKYTEVMDRESAYEQLSAKVQAGAEQAAAEARTQPRTEPQAGPKASQRHEKSMVEQVVGSSAFQQFARSAGREIVRGLFGAARRRR
jgi:DNA helicase HerA-like ATPase